MLLPTILSQRLTTADTGRFDFTNVPDQVRMEMLVAQMDGSELFKDDNGNFIDVCEWKGVECGEGEDVGIIHWGAESVITMRDANSTPGSEETAWISPGGSIELDWIPPGVEEFCAVGQMLHGTLRTDRLPRVLLKLSLSGNELTGRFETSSLPEEIFFVDVSVNAMEGSIALHTLPATLVYFSVAENKFSGSIEWMGLPTSLRYLYLHSNAFLGSIDFRGLPKEMKELEMQNNAFMGLNTVVLEDWGSHCKIKLDRKAYHKLGGPHDKYLVRVEDRGRLVHFERLKEE